MILYGTWSGKGSLHLISRKIFVGARFVFITSLNALRRLTFIKTERMYTGRGGQTMAKHKKRADQRPALSQTLSGMETPHRIFSFLVKRGEKDPAFS
ncbi:hypothetical protein ES703_50188 [subsurface metagenome]